MAADDAYNAIAQALMAPPPNGDQYMRQGQAMPWNNYQLNTPNFNISTQNPGGMAAYYGGGLTLPIDPTSNLSFQGGFAPTAPDRDRQMMMKYTRRF